MIEYGLSVQVNAAEAGKVLLVARGNHAVHHDPIATLSEIVLKFHYQ